MEPSLSVVIPVYNAAATLPRALQSLHAQRFRDFEVILVDDGSTDGSLDSAHACGLENVVVIRNASNAGPAMARNRGIRSARADLIAFMDSDVTAADTWLEQIHEAFGKQTTTVIVGNVKIPRSTILGDAISAQGFPGGGAVGFDRMWRVSPDGHTDHITSCNFAARREVFETHGGFDESFPLAGGEDSELSHRLVKRGVRIQYVPSVVVYHAPRKDLRGWVRWQISRGRSNYHFKRKVGRVGGFVRLRLWSSWNIVRASFLNPRFALILILLAMSFLLQQWGYLMEASKGGKRTAGRRA